MTIVPRFISLIGGRDTGSGGVAGATVGNADVLVAAAVTADTDVGTTVTDTTAADNAVGTVVTNTTSADNGVGTVVGADQTAVEAAVALLEADGASPTQGHVNSLRTVWNTLKTDAATAKTATALAKANAATAKTATALAKADAATAKVDTAALTGTGILRGYDLIVGYDATAVATKSKFGAMLREVIQRVAGDGALTP